MVLSNSVAFNGGYGPSDYATIGGGDGNTVTGSGSVISGGIRNNAIGDQVTIAGGRGNTIYARQHSTIGGGENNVIESFCGFATIGGGPRKQDPRLRQLDHRRRF
jgi:hypothetical protein